MNKFSPQLVRKAICELNKVDTYDEIAKFEMMHGFAKPKKADTLIRLQRKAGKKAQGTDSSNAEEEKSELSRTR